MARKYLTVLALVSVLVGIIVIPVAARLPFQIGGQGQDVPTFAPLLKEVTPGVGNGSHGWPEHAPLDAIIATLAPNLVPPPSIQQLKPGGRRVIRAGIEDAQQPMVVVKDDNSRVKTRELPPVRLSPLEWAAAARLPSGQAPEIGSHCGL